MYESEEHYEGEVSLVFSPFLKYHVLSFFILLLFIKFPNERDMMVMPPLWRIFYF